MFISTIAATKRALKIHKQCPFSSVYDKLFCWGTAYLPSFVYSASSHTTVQLVHTWQIAL